MVKAAKSKRASAAGKQPAETTRSGRKADRPPTKCPICGEPAVPEFFPFSSKRCAEVDLNRWLSGRYFIPAVESEPDDDGPPDDDES
jgi:endogenous inhibitor of DNA gyrase (YacG/DUF329 family)